MAGRGGQLGLLPAICSRDGRVGLHLDLLWSNGSRDGGLLPRSVSSYPSRVGKLTLFYLVAFVM